MNELQIVQKFAESYGADHVYVFRKVEKRNFYRICTKALIGKKTGLPVLVEVVNNQPLKLSAEQIMGLMFDGVLPTWEDVSKEQD